MDEHGVFSVALKWTVLVFAAGFVGYFGKYLGIKVISLCKKNGDKNTGLPAEKIDGDQSGISQVHQGQDRVNKKQDKAHLKKIKKLNKAGAKQQKKDGSE